MKGRWGVLVTTLTLLAVVLGGCIYMQPPPVAEPQPPVLESVRERISIEAAEDVILKNGADLLFYSDDKKTLTGQVDGGTGAFSPAESIIFEGATADAYETTLTVTDPTADRTITLPNSSGTVALNPYGESIEFEGATANDYETTLAVTDPTADRTITLPNMTGTALVGPAARSVVFGSNTITATLAVTHGLTTPQIALCSLGADPTNGEESFCTTTIAGSTVTVKVWKEDIPAAGDSGILVYWMVAGQP